MNKLKNTTKFILTVVLFFALFVGVALCMGNATGTASAETDGDPSTETDAEEPVETGQKTLVGSFIDSLKERYGDDYLYYYNAILEKWGSVEQYLLACVDETTPDVVADGWTSFINWLDKYAVIWVPAIALILVAVAAVVGKKYVKKVYDYAKKQKDEMRTIFGSINKMYRAHLAELQTLQVLLGENERFSENRETLKSAEEEIKHEDV